MATAVENDFLATVGDSLGVRTVGFTSSHILFKNCCEAFGPRRAQVRREGHGPGRVLKPELSVNSSFCERERSCVETAHSRVPKPDLS